jgi:hypothetical protein
MLLIAFLAALGLAPGVYTAVRLHARYGWIRGALAGIGVTVLGVVGLLSALVAFTPLAVVAAAACLLLGLRAYDRGRLITATSWTALAALFASFTGWQR